MEDAFSEKGDRKRSDGNAHEGVFYSLNITQSIITIENTFKSKDTLMFKNYPYNPYFFMSIESARIKTKGLNMAKFIHYYTRFRAHGESAELESRIRKETIMRIKVNLLLSERGDLVWFQKGMVNHPYENFSAEEAKAYKLMDDDVRDILVTHLPSSPSSSGKDGKASPKRFSFARTLSLFLTPKKELKTPLATAGPSAGSSFIGSELSNKLLVSGGDPLLFLSNGFQELLSCRHLLKGSFPYAYYAFEVESDRYDEEDNCYGFLSSLSLERGVIQSRKQQFEQLQAGLESFVEMLSDVVARKRLRASKHQIEQATSAARSKRIELEQFIASMDSIVRETMMKTPSSLHSGRKGDRSAAGRRQSRDLNPRAFGSHGGSGLSNSRAYQGYGRSLAMLAEFIADDDRPLKTPNPEEAMSQLRAAEERVRMRHLERSRRQDEFTRANGDYDSFRQLLAREGRQVLFSQTKHDTLRRCH